MTALAESWAAVSSVNTGYAVLAGVGVDVKRGSLADTIASSATFTFTGLVANSDVREIIPPVNANGGGPAMPSLQLMEAS